MGKKSVRVLAGCSGGGGTDKATRPTGVLTLTRQKEPTGDSSQTLLPRIGTGALTRKELPSAGGPGTPGTTGMNTRRSPAFSASLSAVRCFPLWRTLVLSFPRFLPRNNAVWPSATHEECSASTRIWRKQQTFNELPTSRARCGSPCGVRVIRLFTAAGFLYSSDG